MYKGCFIAGTDTDIGKTFITAALFRSCLLRGRKAAAFKPVQTGVHYDNTAANDAAVYRYAIGDITSAARDFHIETFYRFSVPCSPHIVARLEGQKS